MPKFKRLLLTFSAIALIPLCGARASTIDFGTITGAGGDDSRSWADSVSGSFTDYATFLTTSTDSFSASVTNSYATTPLFISDLTLSLYSGATVGSGTLIDSVVATDTGPAPGSQSANLFAFAEDPGSYYLSISGSTADSPSYGGSLSVAVSTVPLPASLALFGGALTVVSMVTCGRKLRKAATAG